MEVFFIKNEYIDAIKYFFINKIKLLLILLIIGVSVIIGWNYWQLHEANSLQESAQFFEKISSQLQTGSHKAIVNAEQFASKINNIYGVLTNIELAKIAVEKTDIAGAEKILLKTLAIAKFDDLEDLLNIRLARVQLALNNPNQTLITLAEVKNKGWSAIVEDIRGDALLKKADIVGARAAYSRGIESSGAEMMKTILEMKINSLPN